MVTKKQNEEMLKMEAEQILNELRNFSGTESYHKFSILSNMVLTDGMNFLCQNTESFWLMDIVSSVQHLKKIVDNKEFIVWRIKLNENDKGFVVEAYRDSPFNQANLLYQQFGGYYDFPISYLEFYQCENVILLKSEY